MEHLHRVYEYNAHHLNGSVTHGGKLNKSDLTKFELIPQAPYLPKITIDLSGERELIYFKRVFCTNRDGIYHIDYHIGYNEFEIVINAVTGEVNI